jgi:ribosome-associated toxin RatA of RatAB toxin-antitoxin module
MKSIKFTETIRIRRRPEVIFDYTQDYGNRLQWDTFLKRADLVDGATAAGKGVKSYCVARNGIGMETVYVSFNRPRATAVQMTRGPYLFKTFQGSWTFKALPGGDTEVIFLYSFTAAKNGQSQPRRDTTTRLNGSHCRPGLALRVRSVRTPGGPD